MVCAVQPECFCTQRELTFHHSSPRARRFVVLAALGRAGVGLVLRTSSSQSLQSHVSRAAYARIIGARSEDAAPQLGAACKESWAPQGLTVAGLTCLGKAYPLIPSTPLRVWCRCWCHHSRRDFAPSLPADTVVQIMRGFRQLSPTAKSGEQFHVVKLLFPI